MTELLRVYEEIYRFRQEYCVICLRSGHERRMVDIKSLELFIKSINLPFSYHNDFQRICWMCERAAKAAYRLRLAVNLSASVHCLFSLMDRSIQRREVVANQLRGHKEPTGIVQQAEEWQTRLADVRARTALLHTEVLVVASVPPACPPLAPLRPASPPDDSDVYLIPDEAPGAPHPHPAPAPPSPPAPARPAPAQPLHDALYEPEVFMDSVMIEERVDERDPIEIKQEDTPLAQATTHCIGPTTHCTGPTTPSPSIVPLEKLIDDGDNTSFLLHPIVENNGVMTVPSLNAQIMNGQLITIDKSNIVMQTPRLALHNGTNFNLVTEPAQVATFLKTINKNNLSKTSIVSENMPFHILKNNIENMQWNARLLAGAGNVGANLTGSSLTGASLTVANLTVANLTGAENVLLASGQNMLSLMAGKPFANNNIITHSIILDDEDGEVSEGVRKRQGDTDSGRRKRDRDKQAEGPPKKQKETDWEDKIPMDVISYVGATDPNADTLLSREPPLGVISEVHSVTEEAHQALDTSVANSVTTGLNSAALGTNSVNSGINSATSGVNSATSVINSGQPSKTLLSIGNVSGIKSVSSRNSARSGINSNVRTKGAVIRIQKGTETSTKGSEVQRATVGKSVHVNVFPKSRNKRASEPVGEVIDLC